MRSPSAAKLLCAASDFVRWRFFLSSAKQRFERSRNSAEEGDSQMKVLRKARRPRVKYVVAEDFPLKLPSKTWCFAASPQVFSFVVGLAVVSTKPLKVVDFWRGIWEAKKHPFGGSRRFGSSCKGFARPKSHPSNGQSNPMPWSARPFYPWHRAHFQG